MAFGQINKNSGLTEEEATTLDEIKKLKDLEKKIIHRTTVGGKWCCKQSCEYVISFNYSFITTPPLEDDEKEYHVHIRQDQKYSCESEPCEFEDRKQEPTKVSFHLNVGDDGIQAGWLNIKITGKGKEKPIKRNLPNPCKGECKECNTIQACSLYRSISCYKGAGIGLQVAPPAPTPFGSILDDTKFKNCTDKTRVVTTEDPCPDLTEIQHGMYCSEYERRQNGWYPVPGDAKKKAHGALLAAQAAKLDCLANGNSEAQCDIAGGYAAINYSTDGTSLLQNLSLIGADICPHGVGRMA